MNRILLHDNGIAKCWEVGEGRISIRVPDGGDLTGQQVLTIQESSVESLSATLQALIADRQYAEAT